MEIIFVDDSVVIFAVASTWICTVIINIIPAPINFLSRRFVTHDSKGVVQKRYEYFDTRNIILYVETVQRIIKVAICPKC